MFDPVYFEFRIIINLCPIYEYITVYNGSAICVEMTSFLDNP